MLCSDCKKKQAVIYINKVEKSKDGLNSTKEVVGLCMDCAKKRGIDPFANITDAINNMSPDDMDKLSKQFASMMGNMDMSNLSEMMQGFGLDDAFTPGPQDIDADDEQEDNIKNVNTDNKKKHKGPKVLKDTTKTRFLDAFGTNLTRAAKQNKLDKVIGREKELERLIEILNRRSKNNPALIGEPGVGKTAVLNALAQAIASEKVPQRLINKQVYLLDMTSIVAGTQFRGQFEARMKGIIDECKSYSNVILAIDELHNIVGGNEHDNSMNAANILKPALSSGEIQIIGATTLKEYRKYIEKDTALERRFQPVMVDEPNICDTIEILKGIKHYYEEYHNVTIPDEAIHDTVMLAEKYIFDRFFPDKAIDLLDEACSRIYLDNKIMAEIEVKQSKLKEIQEELENINSEGQKEVSDYEKSANLKTTECNLQKELEALKKKAKKSVLKFENLAKVVELWTKIPVSRISVAESEKLLRLEDAINEKIIGQEEAVHALSQAIIRKRSNIKTIVRPPSFIFVGPTGVGKTALVKALAYELFDREDAIIRLDMSEYMESHSVSKLIGSPPGYVGFDDAGYLTEKVRRNPYSIILFDEIEKAHQSIYNILLQILEDGRLTDSQGKTVSFKNTIVILTSNLGTNFKNEGYGFANEAIESELLNIKVESALKEYFSPEFLNRIDDTIVFNKLDKLDALKITKLLLDEYANDIKQKNILISYTESVIKFLTDKGFSEKFGARPLRRAIQKHVEDEIAYKYVTGDIKEGKNYVLDVNNDKIVILDNVVIASPKLNESVKIN